MHQFLLLRHPDHHLCTNASGTWGCSAWSPPHWLQIQWSAETSLLIIALKELFPIVIATAVWGTAWRGKLILCHCYNAAVVAQVNKLHGRDPKAGHMLKCLAFLQAVYDCRIRAIHVAGVNNPIADALSRNRAVWSLQAVTGIPHPHAGPTSMGESDLPASPGLVIRALESNVQRFLEAGIAESTMNVHRAG